LTKTYHRWTLNEINEIKGLNYSVIFAKIQLIVKKRRSQMKKAFVLLIIISIGIWIISASDGRIQNVKIMDLNGKAKATQSRGTLRPDLNFGKFPLYFIANKGQVNKQAKFYAKALKYTIWLTKQGLVFDSIMKKEKRDGKPETGVTNQHPIITTFYPSKSEPQRTQIFRDVSKCMFIDANKNPEIIPIEETKLEVNYFIGNDKSKWHCDIPTSKAVLYKNLYKNIDLKVYGIEKQIEYDWIVKPGGNPADIKFEYKNVKRTRFDEEGNLLIETDFGELIHRRPVSYQEIGNERVEVEVEFKKVNKNTYGFIVGVYNKGHELIIDPVVLAYSTYLGGGLYDSGHGIAVDSNGNVYVTGFTESNDFPTLNQYQTRQTDADIFITKIDTNQAGVSSLIYSTYLGGSGGEFGKGIAVDNSGNVYVTGYTNSTDFPTLNQYQAAQGVYDAFVTMLDTTQGGETGLIYSTYLGGGGSDDGFGIAVDSSGYIYVAGVTNSTDFPTLNQFQIHQGGNDFFITKIDPSQGGASSLIYSTYLGGGGHDYCKGIAVDNSGYVYVTGSTESTDFPTLNQYQADLGDSARDALLTKIDTTQSGASCLIYSTYLGGGAIDESYGIAVDGSGNAYLAGQTNSIDFPILNQYQSEPGDMKYDVFITKVDTTQSGTSSLIYSTYLGGSGQDYGKGIALDNSGYAYVTGWTESTDFPTLNQFQTDQGDVDALVIKIDTTQAGASSLIYSTYLGGNAREKTPQIDVDSSGNAYISGETWSTDFPTLKQYQSNQPDRDVFVTKLLFIKTPTVTTAPVTSITTNSAECGGEVISDGGAEVTTRGVCWSTSPNPTVLDNYTTDGNGTGVFTSAITGLSPNTTYYVKAYAVNLVGTAYGSIEESFTTPPHPTISGTVTDGTSPIQGVAITFSHDGHTETTAADGTYSYSVVYGITTTVTPSKTGYSSWNPANKTFNNIISDQTQNFSGSLNTYTISGTVTDGINPIEGVTITFSHDGHTETTDANGYYSYAAAYGTSTTVTASKSGYIFEPSEYSYTNLTEDKPNQNFTVFDFIFVTIANPLDGEIVSGTVTITAEVSTNGSVTKVEFYIDGILGGQDNKAPYRHRWDTTLVSNTNHTVIAKAYHSTDLTHQDEITVNVNNPIENPSIKLQPKRLNFSAVYGISQTDSETILVQNSGGGTLNWTASVSDVWILATPQSGSDNTVITVSLDVTGLAPGNYLGNIIITDSAADNSPAFVEVNLKVKKQKK
jgi:hypothetical protein